MRVLHLSASDIRGGAARGAFWLHRALVEQGIDSKMLVGRKYGADETVTQMMGRFARVSEFTRDRLDPLPLRFYTKTDESFWTVGWLPRSIAGTIRRLDPDIVHLHWVGAGFMPIEAFRALRRPVVWTLRDMWAFTGGCHYATGCHRYEVSCGACPQLQSDSDNDLSRAVWRHKEKAWRDVDLTLVPISNWLAGCVRRSSLLHERQMEVIPNGLDISRFRPTARDEARAAWDLPLGKRYILFGAIDAFRDKRKGYQWLVEATRSLASRCWTQRAEILVFGDDAPDGAPELGLPSRFLGHISDDHRLAQLYAAADVMVVPSIEEAFGKTLVEAMACGTPVVAFDDTGPADIVAHRETGYLATPFESEDLANGIEWCLSTPDRSESLGRTARQRAESLFDIGAVAGRYVDLYRRILKEAA